MIIYLFLLNFCFSIVFFFFNQKTAYEMRIRDWSSDLCSSDLWHAQPPGWRVRPPDRRSGGDSPHLRRQAASQQAGTSSRGARRHPDDRGRRSGGRRPGQVGPNQLRRHSRRAGPARATRSEEHTSELQSLMRTSYAVFCLKKKKKHKNTKLKTKPNNAKHTTSHTKLNQIPIDEKTTILNNCN